MTSLFPRRTACGATILLLFGLPACGHTGPTRYLDLAAIPPAQPPAATSHVLVNVGRVTVRWPPAFDRLEVVRPVGEVEVQVDELARWSAAPGELASSTLAQDLRARAPSLTLDPVGAVPTADVLDVEVEVLGVTLRERAYTLTASVVIDGAGVARAPRTFVVSAPQTGAGAAAEAEALSRLLAELADQITPYLDGSPHGAVTRAARRPSP